METVSSLWAPALAGSHRVAQRVEVWDQSGTTLLTSNLAVLGGGFTDTWVCGMRRTLSLTVAPTDARFIYPGVEIRPYAGINYGTGAPELLPLGRFPIYADSRSLTPADSLTVAGQDRWSWVAQATFLSPATSTVALTIIQQISKLLTDTGRWTAAQITITATSTAKVAQLTWDTDRGQAIIDLCTSAGAEVYIDRTGNPTIRNRPTVGASQLTITDGAQGSLVGLVTNRDYSSLRNIVRVYCTNPDPALQFAAVTMRITDPASPANPSKIGQMPYSYTDPSLTTTAQAVAAGQKLLTRLSTPSRQLTIDQVPNFALNASDTITPQANGFPPELAMVQSVTHPLDLGTTQKITAISTRTDEASGL